MFLPQKSLYLTTVDDVTGYESRWSLTGMHVLISGPAGRFVGPFELEKARQKPLTHHRISYLRPGWNGCGDGSGLSVEGEVHSASEQELREKNGTLVEPLIEHVMLYRDSNKPTQEPHNGISYVAFQGKQADFTFDTVMLNHKTSKKGGATTLFQVREIREDDFDEDDDNDDAAPTVELLSSDSSSSSSSESSMDDDYYDSEFFVQERIAASKKALPPYKPPTKKRVNKN